ncbi:flagellar assembly protein H [Pusillimonas sp. T7-7]|uniref:flagellar assembly protein FliH n=1 Tax=Pusillimonas sp. (strain T7-7) TaxID=1007105 RepID=UPI0002084870|nr:flagellar assembly protein FliH [Pusillimonas sp. T7-7]AEC19327.1 flagellar assembly protein H [Pusillimonas sp. T7-7]
MSDKLTVSSGAEESWKRWEMAAFESPAAADAAGPATPPAAPQVDNAALLKKVQQLREAAQKRGHDEGYAAGHVQGLEVGTAEGHEQGRQRGYEAGFAAGHAAGREEADKETKALNALAVSAAASIETMEAEMGQALIALAIRIAEQVLRSTLDSHPEKIQDLVHDILQIEAGKDAMLKLRVNPADAELVRQCLDGDPGARHWRLVTDSTISRGGCMVETALGNIDATLQTRWQRVVSALGHESRLERLA